MATVGGWIRRRNMKKNTEPSGLYEKIYESEQKRRVAEAESEARSMEAARRTAAKGRRRSILRALTTFVLVLGAFVLLLTLIYKFIFVISDISVTGNGRYSAGEITEAAGVADGDNLYSFSSRIVGEKVRLALPYVKKLEVRRDIPNRITFAVEEYSARFYAYIYGQRCILSEDLTVLELEPGGERCEGLCYLSLPAVREAVCGKKLAFRTQLDEDHVYAAVGSLLSSELSERMTAILMEDTYSLFMECDAKYLLNFGNYADSDIKLRVASVVLKDEMFSTENKMRVDLTKNSETTVIIDNTLVLH